MDQILNAPIMQELIRTCSNMYRLGWNERNGGNISLILEEAELKKYLDTGLTLRKFSINFDAKELAGNAGNRIELLKGNGGVDKGFGPFIPVRIYRSNTAAFPVDQNIIDPPGVNADGNGYLAEFPAFFYTLHDFAVKPFRVPDKGIVFLYRAVGETVYLFQYRLPCLKVSQDMPSA
ncbi:hypothetical protein FACS189442_5800 [Spirochaetia bacterium]|nr:hypothetical protein FACS189442_5800 [Spirochaetia bacterium]